MSDAPGPSEVRQSGRISLLAEEDHSGFRGNGAGNLDRTSRLGPSLDLDAGQWRNAYDGQGHIAPDRAEPTFGVRASTLLVAAACLLAAACSAGSADGLGNIPEGVPNELLTDVSEFQQEILSDGEVSFGEYEKAILATISCLKQEQPGVEVSPLTFDPADETFNFGFGGAYTESGIDVVNDSYLACYEEYEDVIAVVWAIQHAPSAEEERAFYEQILTCMADKGFDVVIDASPTNLGSVADAAPDAYTACFDEALEMEP